MLYVPLALPVPVRETAPLDVAVTVAPPATCTPISKLDEPEPLPAMLTPPPSALTWALLLIRTPSLPEFKTPPPLPPPVPLMLSRPDAVLTLVPLSVRKTP